MFDTVRVQAVQRVDLSPELSARIKPIVLARDAVHPVAEAFAAVCPDGGLRRGSTVAVSNVSVALGLMGAATAAGAWLCAVQLLGEPAIGWSAAGELGVVPDRVVAVSLDDAANAAAVIAAAIDSFELVLVGAAMTGRIARDARRLQARARERGAVLMAIGAKHALAEGADLRLGIADTVWHGLGTGYGVLDHRRVTIEVQGRRAASLTRRASMLLPDSAGRPAVCDASITTFHQAG
jgi:hypothetical protein